MKKVLASTPDWAMPSLPGSRRTSAAERAWTRKSVHHGGALVTLVGRADTECEGSKHQQKVLAKTK